MNRYLVTSNSILIQRSVDITTSELFQTPLCFSSGKYFIIMIQKLTSSLTKKWSLFEKENKNIIEFPVLLSCCLMIRGVLLHRLTWTNFYFPQLTDVRQEKHGNLSCCPVLREGCAINLPSNKDQSVDQVPPLDTLSVSSSSALSWWVSWTTCLTTLFDTPFLTLTNVSCLTSDA